MILSDISLEQLCTTGWDGNKHLVDPYDPALLNAASLDIRIGEYAMIERDEVYTHKCPTCFNPFGISGVTPDDKGWLQYDLRRTTQDRPFMLRPGEFILVQTLERIRIPNDCAMDLRMKSTSARRGLDHSLAFWFDPGWDGVGTMELQNVSRYRINALYYGQRIAQMILHRLDQPARKPYQGRYQGSTVVSFARPVGRPENVPSFVEMPQSAA